MVFSFRIKRKDKEQSCSYSSAEIAQEVSDEIGLLRRAASAGILPNCVGRKSWGDPNDWDPIESPWERYLYEDDEELDDE